jgi:hypothetical protein
MLCCVVPACFAPTARCQEVVHAAWLASQVSVVLWFDKESACLGAVVRGILDQHRAVVPAQSSYLPFLLCNSSMPCKVVGMWMDQARMKPRAHRYSASSNQCLHPCAYFDCERQLPTIKWCMGRCMGAILERADRAVRMYIVHNSHAQDGR